MFSLILSIVSIALVVVLISATLYYGGNAHDDAIHRVTVAQYTSQIEQVRVATNSFIVEKGVSPTSMQELVDENYLNTVPGQWNLSLPGNSAFAASALNSPNGDAANLALCREVNEKLKVTGEPPLCSAVPDNFWGCCQTVN